MSRLEQGRAAREEAIGRVTRHADSGWKARAAKALGDLCLAREELTTDDLWHALGEDVPREPRAIAAILRMGQKRGWCEPTDRYVQSTRPECHARPIRVWRSNMRM